MGVKLFLIRHGQTEWNSQGRYQGAQDTILTKTGIKQARLARKYLSGVNFANFYSSPKKRAIQTANIITDGLNIKVNIREDLKELNFGKWEGLTFENINTRYKQDYQSWLSDPYNNPPTDGESFKVLLERAGSEINKIVSENLEGSNVGVVTHGGVIIALLVNWLQIPSQCWRSLIQRQGAINVVVIDKEFPYISQINYTGHLQPIYDENEDKVIEIYSKLKDKE
jgi:alpha-ribazole phosphatase